MRRCRRECLLALCLISFQLLARTSCESPALTPAFVKQVDDVVEHLWLKCGLDKSSLENVRKHFDYSHVFDILRSIAEGKEIKDINPGAGENANKALSPEVRSSLLDCFNKQPLVAAAQEVAKNLSIDYIKTLLAALRKDVAQGSSDTEPETNPAEEVSSSKKSAAKKESSSGMPTAAIIGLSVAGIALLALLFLCCCMFRATQTSSYDLKDDKPLLGVNLSGLSAASHKSAQVNPIDVNKLGALSLKSEAGQNGNVKVSSSEDPSTEAQPAIYNSSDEQMPALTSSAPGSVPTPPPVKPPPAPPPKSPPAPTPPKAPPPTHPKNPAPSAPEAPAPSAPEAPAPPSGPAPVLPSEPSPPPAPKAAPPPPPPKSAGPSGPPPPALPGSKIRPPPPLKKSGNKVDEGAGSHEAKTKLKPFFWDKVAANANQSMVWDQIKAGSFQFNEEMMENLFGYNTIDKKGSDGKKDLSSKDAFQLVRILDPKKAQNLAISLRALSVSPEEVCCAVKEGNELPSDLIQTLIRWTPSSDEELRLRLYTGELSQLGPAEQFLKAIIDIPYIYQRLDSLLFMASLPEEASNVKQSFATLEVACQELKNSRLFLKLLEAVLKTGNRMNVGTFRGDAQAFKLDTLLKLSDVKGTDGKTTLLHFVVQEITRSEGVRAARAAKEQNSSVSGANTNDLADGNNEQTEDEYKQLGLKVVSSLGDDLQNVKKAAILDADQLTMSVASLGHKLVKTKEFLNTSMTSLDEDSGFNNKLKHFTEQSQIDVTFLLEEEKKIRSLVRGTVDYFHGSTGKDEGLRLFVVVRDFLAMLDKVCKEVKEASKVAPRKTQTQQPSQTHQPLNDPRRNLFPAIQDRRADSSSSSSDED
ncbi:hypothetical protein ACP70R_005690 [Stipagrostis hirtigluma subsp. patula]